MTSTSVLERGVTAVDTREMPVQGRPVPTVEGAFRAARLTCMNAKTRRRLKYAAELAIYRDVMKREPTSYSDIRRMGWMWHVGEYSVATRTYKALGFYGNGETDVPADPIFAHMAAGLDRELREVPGIRHRFVVESYWTDPIGGVEITTEDGAVRTHRFYAWYGNRTTWPPSRG